MNTRHPPKVILGSQSPRRREILGYFSLPFEHISPDFNEESILFNGDPAQYVTEIASGKGFSLSKRFPDALILTADTTVYKDGKIYGKPANTEEAFQALSELAGEWHCVFTGISLTQNKQQWNCFEETHVLFNPLTPEEIRHYHKKLHWSDKAGGYAIQMAGGLAIKKIDGCYYNAMGLPINSVRSILLNVGIDLWDYLK